MIFITILQYPLHSTSATAPRHISPLTWAMSSLLPASICVSTLPAWSPSFAVTLRFWDAIQCCHTFLLFRAWGNSQGAWTKILIVFHYVLQLYILNWLYFMNRDVLNFLAWKLTTPLNNYPAGEADSDRVKGDRPWVERQQAGLEAAAPEERYQRLWALCLLPPQPNQHPPHDTQLLWTRGE